MSSQITPAMPTQEWTLIASASATGANDMPFSSIPAYDIYKFEALITQDSAGAAPISMRFNGDAGANYASWSAFTTLTAAQTGVVVAQEVATTNKFFLQILFNGKTAPVASGRLTVTATSSAAAGQSAPGGYWVGGNATQVNAISFDNAFSGTFAYTARLYGKMI